MASQADVAIVYVGTMLAVEAEGRDRTTLALPGSQESLIKAVVATGRIDYLTDGVGVMA